MNDPLGLINSGGGINPLDPLRGDRIPGVQKPRDPNEPGFKDVLMKNLAEVNQLQQDATTAIEDLQTGKRDDLETVLAATAKADNAFRMLLQVRNKVLDAYEEIKQIRV